MQEWRRAAIAAVYLVGSSVGAGAVPPQAVLVDRLVAIIGEQALTWRDVEAARLLGSIPPGGAPRDAVERLVTRELMHGEVDRLAVAPPIAAAVDERLERARQRAGGPEAFARSLASLGLSETRARQWVADDLAIDVYVDQRFTAAAQPTDVEVTNEATAGGRAATAEALADARRRLVQTRRTALVDDWLTGLRDRGNVQITWPR